MEKISQEEVEQFIDLSQDLESNSDEGSIENSINDILNETPVATPEDFENSKLIDFNKIPDNLLDENNLDDEDILNFNPILEEREKLKPNFTPDDMMALLEYVSGKSDRPLSIDKFSTNLEEKLKNLTYFVNLYQLMNLPMLMSYQNAIREELYNKKTLRSMDIKDLTSISSNLTKEISSIISNANQANQTISQYASSNTLYNTILGKLVLLSEDKLDIIRKNLEEISE